MVGVHHAEADGAEVEEPRHDRRILLRLVRLEDFELAHRDPLLGSGRLRRHGYVTGPPDVAEALRGADCEEDLVADRTPTEVGIGALGEPLDLRGDARLAFIAIGPAGSAPAMFFAMSP